MKLLIIGDVHGCYYSLKALINRYWDAETTHLIQLGDLINKGPHSGCCVRYWQELEQRYPERVTLLRGNHEQMYLDACREKKKESFAKKLSKDFKAAGLKPSQVRDWLYGKPLLWKNDHLLITHAGVAKNADDDIWDDQNKKGVLYYKGELSFLPQKQVIGHNIVEGGKPLFSPKENAWRIDTGLWQNGILTSLLLSPNGVKQAVYQQVMDSRDQNPDKDYLPLSSPSL